MNSRRSIQENKLEECLFSWTEIDKGEMIFMNGKYRFDTVWGNQYSLRIVWISIGQKVREVFDWRVSSGRALSRLFQDVLDVVLKFTNLILNKVFKPN